MTSRPAGLAIVLASLALGFALSLSASDAHGGTVVGQVTDARSGLPVPELLVRLIPRVTTAALPADDARSRNEFPVNSTTTDQDGAFQFDDVAPGRYLVIAGTIRAGMSTERFNLVGDRAQALNMVIAEGIRPQAPPFRELPRLDLEDTARLEAERAQAAEEGRDAARVAARNRDILTSLDDDDDGAGPSVFIPEDQLNGNVRRADRARRGIFRDDDDRFGDDDDDDDDDFRSSGRRDDEDRLDDDDDDGDDDDDDRGRMGARGRDDDDDDDGELDDDDVVVTRRRPGSRDEIIADGHSGTGDITRGEGGPNNTGNIARGEGGPNNTRDISRADGLPGGTRDVSRDDGTGNGTDVSTSPEGAERRRARSRDDADGDTARTLRNSTRVRPQPPLQRPTRVTVPNRTRPTPLRTPTQIPPPVPSNK